MYCHLTIVRDVIEAFNLYPLKLCIYFGWHTLVLRRQRDRLRYRETRSSLNAFRSSPKPSLGNFLSAYWYLWAASFIFPFWERRKEGIHEKRKKLKGFRKSQRTFIEIYWYFQEHPIVTTGKTIYGSSIPWLDQCNCGLCKVNLTFVIKNNSLNTSQTF